jgi:elongation of very long chain fatty acids protein 6
MCNRRFCYGATGLWTFLFVFSKIPELVDTVFIVLRKQELIFLHYYHHATVLAWVFYTYSELNTSGRWYEMMNYTVHSVMYTYYALKSMKVSVPKILSKSITSLQLLQMAIGCVINYWAFFLKKRNDACGVSYECITFSLVMYISYFLLFAQFFINAYLSKAKKKVV